MITYKELMEAYGQQYKEKTTELITGRISQEEYYRSMAKWTVDTTRTMVKNVTHAYHKEQRQAWRERILAQLTPRQPVTKSGCLDRIKILHSSPKLPLP